MLFRSEININFLLIDIVNSEENFNKIINIPNINFVHKYFLAEDCSGDIYLRDNELIKNKFADILMEFDIKRNDIDIDQSSKV